MIGVRARAVAFENREVVCINCDNDTVWKWHFGCPEQWFKIDESGAGEVFIFDGKPYCTRMKEIGSFYRWTGHGYNWERVEGNESGNACKRLRDGEGQITYMTEVMRNRRFGYGKMLDRTHHGDPKRGHRFWVYKKGKIQTVEWDTYANPPTSFCTNCRKIETSLRVDTYECLGHF